MVEFKLNIGDPASKKTLKKSVDSDVAKVFMGKKIGSKINGNDIGHDGYEFEIKGGSDKAGFPMRRDVSGLSRKKVLIVKGTGIRKNAAGRKKRKTVASNTVSETTSQINLKVVKTGKEPLFEEEKPAEDAKSEKESSEKKE